MCLFCLWPSVWVSLCLSVSQFESPLSGRPFAPTDQAFPLIYIICNVSSSLSVQLASAALLAVCHTTALFADLFGLISNSSSHELLSYILQSPSFVCPFKHYTRPHTFPFCRLAWGSERWCLGTQTHTLVCRGAETVVVHLEASGKDFEFDQQACSLLNNTAASCFWFMGFQCSLSLAGRQDEVVECFHFHWMCVFGALLFQK